MGQIYSAPKEIKTPSSPFDGGDWRKDEQRYIDEVTAFCKENSNSKGKYVGKQVKFPVADGQAVYVVLSLKPLVLIHLEIGDAWHYQHIERLTAKDIKENVEQQERLAKLFS